ncbi:DUF2167 domain-containing protein [Paraburkholderia bannensis]|uniref:DUF2167 domain-containing protein n=1 Tax=Paraburkholderia bannensis TaxID=765414 RepID=UPI002AC33174|nr:DUF2167 domain-containing protein [Paraburkholderia bannensis]
MKKQNFLIRYTFWVLLGATLATPGWAQAAAHHHALPTAKSATPDQPASTPLDSSISTEVWHNTSWVEGPKTVPLGKVATIDIPAGFRYLPPPSDDDAGASQTDASDQPASDPLTSVLAPNDGSWTMSIVTANTGHTWTDSVYLSPESLAWELRQRLSPFDPSEPVSEKSLASKPLVTIEWIREPRWNADKHKLDWSYENTTMGGMGGLVQETTDLNAVWLGRRSAVALQIELDGDQDRARATALQPTFDKLTDGIKFRQGEGYGDYQSGDPKSGLKLADYITGPETEEQQESDQKLARAAGFDWHGLALRILPLLAIGIAAWGRLQSKKRKQEQSPVQMQEQKPE